jgi:hypothetical protein
MNQETLTGADRDEMHTRLFSNMVMQYASMALMFMGQTPHPETGETVKDLEAAQMFVGQLEMLEAKTKGNLNKQEEALLKQSLMTTRLAFVEAVESGGPEPGKAEPAGTATPPQPSESAKPGAGQSDDPAAAAPAEERKKFVKKY